MATATQLKSLIRAHFESEGEKFRTIALQIAAHEAKIGHTSNARELKEIIQNSKYHQSNKIIKFNQKLDILEHRHVNTGLKDLIVSTEVEEKIKRMLAEYNKKDLLRKNGLMNRSKLLLAGDPGTGKTMTASVIAGELYLPLYTIQLDRLITKFMGETSVKLRQVFDQIKSVRGVYLFDEFDAIASDRNMDNDVGEMRRILNSFLQYIEDEDSHSVIIAATNHPDLLDKAVFRRFDDVLQYHKPDRDQIKRLLTMKLSGKAFEEIFDEEIYRVAAGLNHSDIVKACEDAIKYSIMEECIIGKKSLIGFLQNRKGFYKYKKA